MFVGTVFALLCLAFDFVRKEDNDNNIDLDSQVLTVQ